MFFIISERSHWLLSPCQCQDGGGRVAGQLQAKPRGGAAGARQLHCAVLWMQRSEVRGEPTRSGLGGSKFKRLSFQFQFRQWSAVDYWYPCTVTMRCRGAVLIIGLLTPYQYFVRVGWKWKGIMYSSQIEEPKWLHHDLCWGIYFIFFILPRCGQQRDVWQHAECWDHQHINQRV